ncbi:MAG: hypothetical protein ACFCVC_06635 [Acidimicrobiia bacterium]
MGRFVTALGALALGITLAGELASSGDTGAALGLATVSVMVFAGLLADPGTTGLVVLGAVGLVLGANGRPLEGLGLVVVAGMLGGRMVGTMRRAPARPNLILVKD